MPWIRIDENALDHPKIAALSDGAFRLWVAGLGYVQRFLTDGVLPPSVLRGLRAFTPGRVRELLAVRLWREGADGYLIHDYHAWNDSRETVLQRRQEARDRMARLRSGERSGERSREPPTEVRANRGANVRTNVRDSTPRTRQNVRTEHERSAASTPADDPPANAERPRYDAGPFCVFDWQHRDYQDRLTIGHREDFDLDAWYRQVAGELEARGESLPPRTVHGYLSRRLYADAGLRLPSLTGRSRGDPARASPEDQAAKAARQAERDAAQTERDAALAARLDALAPDERTALEETAREALREHAPYLAPSPADLRRAMLLELARRYRGQPIPASAVATGGEEG